jgi:HCOMODA/2-hydroxy-3-carboxy-muconic semialdehyde decarboxylase
MCDGKGIADTEPPVSVVADAGEPPAAADGGLLQDLSVANWILARYRVVDAFGHVSVRHPGSPGHFLLARNMAPALVAPPDIVTFGLDGTPCDASGRGIYLERFIHGEIYRLRPDVQSVVHSHAPAVVPFGIVSGAALKPVWHMSGFLGLQTPVFEIREFGGDATDLLIRSRELGVALARSLGDNSVVLMRGHGATVVGDSLKQAVYRAVYTQVNAELQLKAHQLGEINFLTAGECETASRSVGSQVDRAWGLWQREVHRDV